MSEKKPFFKSKKFIIIASVIGVLILLVVVKGQQKPIPEFSSAAVEQTTLVQSVSETGSVVADLEVSYGFEISGRVTQVLHRVGDTVKTGDVIARLNTTKEVARLNEARSALASAQAQLNLKVVGASDQEIEKSLASVEQALADKEQVYAAAEKDLSTAQKAVDTAKNNLQLVSNGQESELITDAYDDMVNTLKSTITSLTSALSEVDGIVGVDNTLGNDDFESYLGVTNVALLTNAKDAYKQAKQTTGAVQIPVLSLNTLTPQSTVDSVTVSVSVAISDVQKALFSTQILLQGTRPLGQLSQTELETLQSNINASQVTVDTAANSVTNGKQAISAAKNALTSYTIAYNKAVSDLANVQKQVAASKDIADAKVRAQQAAHAAFIAAPRAVDIASLRADVARQSANVSALATDVAKGEMRALVDGVISELDVEVGEIVTAQTPIVTLISKELLVEVDVSESDIAKITIGDPVRMTLDAFGDDVVLSGSVIRIEPAQTEVSGVIYYKTKITFADTLGKDIRPGMTANIDITTEEIPDVLVVPQRAVLEKDGQKFVRVLTDSKRGTYREQVVTVGLRGDNGQIQILSGLSLGDEIITFIKE
jgi:RND family efflux transporter MFP subunit